MEIYAINKAQYIEENKYESLLNYVSDEKRKSTKKYHFYKDSVRTLLGDLLVRLIITSKYNIKNQDLVFEKNKYGKPFVKNIKQLDYNISHSGDWVVCIIDTAVVGIDVEQIKPIELDIAKRFFSIEEYNDLIEKAENERLSYFFDLWTLKESYIKACGMGLSIPLDTFSFKVNGENIILNTKREEKDFLFKQYNIDKDYKLSACAVHNDFPQEIIYLDTNYIYNTFINMR